MLAQVSVAAATAVLGADLMNGSVFKQSTNRRYLRGVALAGSAAAGDTKIELLKGSVRIAEVFNVTTGFPTRDHLFPVGEWIDANDEITATVTDAAATNPINMLLDFVG